MDISGVSGAGAVSQVALKSPADNVAGGIEETSENPSKAENKEGSAEAVQASAQESGVGNSVNIQV